MSKAGSVYLYSDPHFGDAEHFKLLKANNKVPEGINSVEELDELQIKNINSVAHKCDTLICLGDIGDINYVKRLKAGYKVLITGNHDRGAEYYKRVRQSFYKSDYLILEKHAGDFERDLTDTRVYEEMKSYYARNSEIYEIRDNKLFDEVYSGPLMISDKIILSHEPIVPCPRYLVNLHGHTHDRPHRYEFNEHLYYNFCAEAIDYKPISLSKLIKEGLLSKVDDIHRVAVDIAIDRKAKREKKTV